jgi:PAS domain S-box-containing protein
VDFSLLEAVPDAIVIAHRAGDIAFVNGVAETLFGYDHGELIGKPVEVLLPARFRAAHQVYRGSYHATPRTRPMGLGLDLFALKKNGQEFSAEISLAPLEIDGQVYAVSAIRDVTDRKKVEEGARLYRKAQDEIRERDEFLSIASHELRTPVTALQLQIQLLQRAVERSKQALPPTLAAKMTALDRQTRRIGLLVNELLDVSRMRLGRLELKLEELDLVEVARETVAHLSDEAARSGCALSLAADQPQRGIWDRLRIEQVLTNLISNALKFGKQSPVVVSVGGDATSARFSVQDRGVGIAQEDQLRVFRRFQRAAPTEHFGGLGLGLYIARQIVEAHGGSIRLESSPGQGTTFTVDLPRAAQPTQPQPPMPA